MFAFMRVVRMMTSASLGMREDGMQSPRHWCRGVTVWSTKYSVAAEFSVTHRDSEWGP